VDEEHISAQCVRATRLVLRARLPVVDVDIDLPPFAATL
jgi:hypothetical protein